MAERSKTMQVDIALVRQLAELLNDTGLSEIEVEEDSRKIRVARTMSAVAAPVAFTAPMAAPSAAAALSSAPPAPTEPAAANHAGTVKSPMVGTVYLAASPEAADFVSAGAMVKEGDTLLIIEAMKVMNPIVAPRSGKIAQILVANNQPVEFDQPLVVIE